MNLSERGNHLYRGSILLEIENNSAQPNPLLTRCQYLLFLLFPTSRPRWSALCMISILLSHPGHYSITSFPAAA